VSETTTHKKKAVSRSLETNRRYVENRLGYGTSFDVIIKPVKLGNREAFVLAIDGFVKDMVLLKIVEKLQYDASPNTLQKDPVDALMSSLVAYHEMSTAKTLDEAIDMVLAGASALFIDRVEEAIIVDLRTYPARGPEEPDLEKVVRGPRDGLTETLIFNTALIRRRVRDPQLRVELLQAGRRSKTDIAVMYIADIADPGIVQEVKTRLELVHVDGLPMAEKSVEEFITGKDKFLNPVPTVRYTERPDIAAVHLYEGHVVVLTDTSPSAMILPVTFFHHLQHAEEYHNDAIIGVYLRWIRIMGLLVALAGPALWVALVLDKAILPDWLDFLGPSEPATIPIFLQFVMATIGIDLLRMALIHQPNALATSLGLIGAVLLGQLAVEVGLFSNETILYVVIAALGQFAIPSMELAATVRLFSIFLLLMAGLGRLVGLFMGLVLVFLVFAGTRSVGVPFLYPLIPLHPRELLSVLVRLPWPAYARRPDFLNPTDPTRR